jgi:hypothetical protein
MYSIKVPGHWIGREERRGAEREHWSLMEGGRYILPCAGQIKVVEVVLIRGVPVIVPSLDAASHLLDTNPLKLQFFTLRKVCMQATLHAPSTLVKGQLQ